MQRFHGLKTGVPPRCDLEKEKNLQTTLLGLIHTGDVKSAHDCSEGGLTVAVAESCVSNHEARETPRLIGATIDLSAQKDLRLDGLLFGESQARIVISVAADNAAKVIERSKIMGVPAVKLGTVGGSALVIKTPTAEVNIPVADLYDGWWNSIARAMA